MKISIVTPTLNSERFLQATLSEIRDHCSSEVEHIVVDGGSSDATLEIVEMNRREGDQIHVRAELNQYEAIQFGFEQATGDIFAWLNSDDIYAPWTLALVRKLFTEYADISWLTGMPGFIDAEGLPLLIGDRIPVYNRRWIANGWYRTEGLGNLMQENMFWRRELWERVGGLDLSFGYAGDFDLWTRFAEHAALVSVGMPLAFFRKHGANRSSCGSHYGDEVARRCAELGPLPCPLRWIGRSQALRHVVRWALPARGERITTSFKSGEFHRKSGLGSSGRFSLGSLTRQIR